MSTPALTAQMFSSIQNYDDEKRLNYLLKEVIVQQKIWLLTDEHGCMMLNTEDDDCVPVWPNEEFAQQWANGDWKACKPTAISLDTWYSRWSLGLTDDDLAIVAFPLQGSLSSQGIVLYPDEFEAALRKVSEKQPKNP